MDYPQVFETLSSFAAPLKHLFECVAVQPVRVPKYDLNL